MTRRITLVVDENGASVMEGQGEVCTALLPAEAVALWVFRNRHKLGLEFELIARAGVFISPPQFMEEEKELRCER